MESALIGFVGGALGCVATYLAVKPLSFDILPLGRGGLAIAVIYEPHR